MMSKAATGELLALAALLMFSTNVILTKIASVRLSLNTGFLVSVSVNVAFAALLFCAQLALRQEALHWDWLGSCMFLVAGIFSTYLGRWFFFESIARLGPAKASSFQVSSPLFVVIIAWLFLGERLSMVAVAAIALTLVGLFLVSGGPAALTRSSRGAATSLRMSEVEGATRPRPQWSLLLRSGMFLGAGSSAAYAVGNVLRGAAIRHWHEAIFGALLGALAGIGLHILFGSGNANVLRNLRKFDRTGLLLYSVGGILTISAQMCIIASMEYIPVAVATLITLCTPILVFPMSYFFLKNEEGISARTVLGGAVALAGIGMIILF